MKKLILLALLLGVVGAGVGFMIYNKPHQNMKSAKADFTLPATELFAAYEFNETTANEKYLGKVIEVTGTVQDVQTDEDGTVSLTLDAGGMLGGVICKLDDLSDHARTEFSTGEGVTLKGRCTGVLMDVVMVRCVEI